jgi:gas vesicle protein
VKELLYVILGAVIGAVVALLFAPSSGEELRARIGQEAEIEQKKLQAEYEKSLQLVHDRIDSMHQDLAAKIQKTKQGETDESS